MKKQNDKPCNTIDTLIGVNTEIKGDISFNGGLRVDGKVIGNILAGNDKSSTLVLSEHALVKGNIAVPHLVINGRIEGNVSGAESIELQAQAEIVGDVHYRMIEMALGASVNGNLVRDDSETRSSVTPLKTVAGGAEDDN
ncbi:MAG: polymer-forming cytoskeletal protein [Gammaproteobacteria bacterium]|nr:polymer-forming cytoskeletal protein [Gammaproteobacteria bacterium]